MWSSPLISGTSIVTALLVVQHAFSQSIPGALFLNGSGSPNAAPYQLVDNYDPSTFFGKFNFYSGYDPGTYGHV
ncbi:hypothetical protein LTS14_005561 [Recurvomyces mirabilis]|nr:hypothetical protein LTS14_005561 [Recurvomyces mirabilis]